MSHLNGEIEKLDADILQLQRIKFMKEKHKKDLIAFKLLLDTSLNNNDVLKVIW